MSDKLKPKPIPSFYFKNIPLFYGLLKSRIPGVVKWSANSVKRLDNSLYPYFEGTGGPMEEGMIYLMFNSEGKESVRDIDTVMRTYWIAADQLRFHILDSYLISQKFPNYHMREPPYQKPIFKNLSKTDFHQEVSLEGRFMEMDGNWKDGYRLNFDFDYISVKGDLKQMPLTPKTTLFYMEKDGDQETDYNLNFDFDYIKMNGDLKYTALTPESTLVYANGGSYIAPHLNVKFYDSFGVKAVGKVNVAGSEVAVNNGRGIIEHGLGILTPYDISAWKWMNLQFENGAMHLFHTPLEKYNIDLREGAAVINDKWHHYLRNDFSIEEVEEEYDEIWKRETPIKWRVDGRNFLFDITCLKKIGWLSTRSRPHLLNNYLLDIEGEFAGEEIKGRGTYEYLLNL